MYTIDFYKPGSAWECHPVTELLKQLDQTRGLAGDEHFLDRARPTNLLVTRLVATADDGRPVGFLSGRLDSQAAADGLSGSVALLEYIGVLRGHGCADPGGD